MRRRSSRRSGPVPGRRFAFAAALVLCLLFSTGAVATADDSPTVVSATVYGPAGTPPTATVSWDDLESNPSQCPVYDGPAPTQNGPGASYGANDAWSLATILQCMTPPISVSDVQSVTILNQLGEPEISPDSQLSQSDLTPGKGDWVDPQQQPIITYGGPAAGDFEPATYYRPDRSASDKNFADSVSYAPPINIQVSEGNSLGVTITTAPKTITAGESIAFNATVTGSQGTLSYHWDFDTGDTSSEPSPTESFSEAGTRDVGLQVRDSNGDVGIAPLVPITVNTTSGAPPEKTGTTPQNTNGVPTQSKSTTGTQRSPAPASGDSGKPGGSQTPGNRHGSKNGGAQHSRRHGKSHGKRSSHRTTGGAGTDGTSTGGAGTGSAGKSGSTPSATSSVPSSPLPPSATPSATHSHGPHHPASSARNRSTVKSAPGGALPGSENVIAGRLITGVNPLPLSRSPLVHPEAGGRSGQQVVRQGVTVSAVGALAGALTVVLLLGLGAARELRGRRTWRTLTFGI
jgi:PKD domain